MSDEIFYGNGRIRVFHPVLKSKILKEDEPLNYIAAGSKSGVSCKALSEDSIKAVCKAFDELIPEVDLNKDNIIAATKERIELHVKLFKNEYMNDKTGDNQYESNYTDEIDKKTILDMDEVLYAKQRHKLYKGESDDERAKWGIKWLSIGDYTDKAQMVVRVFGHITSATRAIFLIGGLHGDEYGGKRAIKIMKNHIKKNPGRVFSGTVVFVLNPANNTNDRNINGIDPNRAFFLQDTDIRKPNEVKAISTFLLKLARKFKYITIISGHTGREKKEREKMGTVFPLYKLTNEGRKLVKQEVEKEGKNGYYENGIKTGGDKKYFDLDHDSIILRRQFHSIIGFFEDNIWRDEIYNGELINFTDMYIPNATMIEFETPKSTDINDGNAD